MQEKPHPRLAAQRNHVTEADKAARTPTRGTSGTSRSTPAISATVAGILTSICRRGLPGGNSVERQGTSSTDASADADASTNMTLSNTRTMFNPACAHTECTRAR